MPAATRRGFESEPPAPRLLEDVAPGIVASTNALSGRSAYRSLRWLVLFVFPIGYLVCDHSIGPLGTSFPLLTLADALACAVLLYRLDAPLRRTLWVWVGLVLLLDGLFINLFVFTAKIQSTEFIAKYYAGDTLITPQGVLHGYPWITLGFVVFCLTSSFAVGWDPMPRTPRPSMRPPQVSTIYAHQIAGVVFLAYLGASLIEAQVGYGQLGQAATLPFHLGTALTFLRDNLALSLFVLVIWVLDSARSRWTPVAMGLLVVCALVDGLVSTSRGSLFNLLTPVVLLALLTQRFTKGRRIGAVLLILTGLLLVPFFSSLRLSRIGTSSATAAPTPVLASLEQSALFVVDRGSQIDGVLQSLGHEGNLSVGRTITFLQPGKLTDYYTHQVVGVQVANDYRNAGLVGGLMVVGGVGAVIIFTIVFTLLMRALWRALDRLQCWPVALALAASAFGIFLLGGGLDFYLFVKLAMELGLCEFVYRKVLVRASSGVPTDSSQPAALSFTPF